MKQRVAIALGSNLGDRAAHIATARDALRQLACNDQPFLQAPLYESAPVDCPPDSNPFLNTTIECSFNNLSPLDLLNFCRQLEQNAKRDSPRPRNAPRTLDVDILYFNNTSFTHPDLVLPHPRMAQRPFVLLPLAQIAANHIPAGWQFSISETLNQLTYHPHELTLVTNIW